MSHSDKVLRDLTGYCLRLTSSAAMAQFKHVFARYGLRRRTFSALALVNETPGLRQSDLAEALMVERPNLVQIVDDLEAGGLVVREVSKEDLRAYALQPTPAGRRLYAKAIEAARAHDRTLTRGLTPEQIASFHEALRVIERNAAAPPKRAGEGKEQGQ